MNSFITDIPAITPSERDKLRSFCAASPLSILLIRKASPLVFDEFFGHERSQVIVAALLDLLSADEKLSLQKEPIRPGHLGARGGRT